MEDRELDNLLAKWAQEEIEVPAEVHEKTMQRIRKEAGRQKIKRWGSLASIAAVCCLCVPLAVSQAGGEKEQVMLEDATLMLARSEIPETKEMSSDMVYAVNSAASMKTEGWDEVQAELIEEESVEVEWIERITKLESDNQNLAKQKERYQQAPTPQELAVINAETERLLKLVEEYEQTIDPGYTALKLRLTAVKETLSEI